MPERRHHHVLDRAFLTVGQLHFYFALLLASANTANLPAYFARLRRAVARALTTNRARFRRRNLAHTRPCAATRARVFLLRRAVPFVIAEMLVRLHEIVNREVILAFEEARPAPDDL